MDIQPLVSKVNRLGLSESLSQPNRLTLRQESNHSLSNSTSPIANHTPLTTSKFLLPRHQNNKFLNTDSLANLNSSNDSDGNIDLFPELESYYQNEDISVNSIDALSVPNQSSVNNNELAETLSSNNLSYLDTLLDKKANNKPKSQRKTKSKPTLDSKPQTKKTTKSSKTNKKGKHEVVPLQQPSNQNNDPITQNLETTTPVCEQTALTPTSEIEPLQQATNQTFNSTIPNLETTANILGESASPPTSEVEPLQQVTNQTFNPTIPNIETTTPVSEQTGLTPTSEVE
ncbi:MAG: hypothetical protein V7K48_20825, partial [Nostoc sp.]|uniref:hypothetical protein n=1 Tax=Nostoc sp. TaxID=1180 RepID=UPI002FFD25A8